MAKTSKKMTEPTVELTRAVMDTALAYSAASSETRLLIVYALYQGPCTVGELAEFAGISMSATSQHLTKLKALGLVACKRDAQLQRYRVINEEGVAHLLKPVILAVEG